MESTATTSPWTVPAEPRQRRSDCPFPVEPGSYRSETSLLWLLQLKEQTGGSGTLREK